MKLLHKLLLLVFCAALIPIGLAAAFLSYYRAQSRAGVMELQKNVVQLAALMTEREMQDLSRRFDNVDLPELREHIKDSSKSRAQFQKLMDKNPEFLFFALADKDGQALQSGGDPEFVRLFGNARPDGDALFIEARSTGLPAAGDFEYMFNIPACRIVYPFGNDLYAFAIVNLRDLAEKLEQQHLGNGGLLLADSSGNAIVFSSSIEKLPKESITDMEDSEGIAAVAGENGINYYLSVSSPVRGTGLYVIGIQSAEEAFSGLNSMSWLMAFLALAVSTALYFSALIFAGQAGQPLEELLSAAKRVSEANFNVPIKVNSQFRELSDLIDSFNVMMKDLKHYQDIHLEQIFEEKQKLELLISLISDAIIFCEEKGEIIYANSSAMEIIKNAWPSLPEKQIQGKMQEIASIAGGSGENVISLNISGELKWYAVNVHTVKSKTESPSLFITLHDITLEKEMRQVKEDFFNSAAHDLRAPLLSMQGYVRLLSYTAKDSKQKEYVSVLEDSSKRLFSLIEDILDFSRLDSGSFNINPQEIMLDDFFDSACSAFEPVFSARKISFSHKNLMPEDFYFEADPDLIRRVADNLLSNAAKFAPEGGEVSFTAEDASQSLIDAIRKEEGAKIENLSRKRILFTVRDSGSGIPEDMRFQVFEKYRQLHGSQKNKKGFGLGLAICKKIMELHGGHIWAESGKGGIFRFII